MLERNGTEWITPPQVVLLPRNKTDGNAENHVKLLQAVKRGKDEGDGPSVMGNLVKEKFDGCARGRMGLGSRGKSIN